MNTTFTTKKRKCKSSETKEVAKRHGRGRSSRGVLAGMPELPLDILYEIIQYLVPMDLINLSRTSKEFRQFLLARSAAPLWRSGRLNVEGLPDLPAHLSEPAYAYLAFDSRCHSCSKPNVRTVYWALGVRYCPGCRKEKLFKSKRRAKCLCTDDGDLIVPSTDDYSVSSHLHLKEQSLHDAKQQFDGLDEEGKEAHLSRVAGIMKWAGQCEIWNRDLAYDRDAELQDLKNARLLSIVARLRDLGWDDELNRMQPEYTPLRHFVDVNQTRPLTDRIWNNIAANMTELMQSIQRQRLEAERQLVLEERCSNFQTVYRAWYARQDNKHVLPRAIDLMSHPEVKPTIEADNEPEVPKACFEAMEGRFEEWSLGWRADCDEKLRKLVRDSPAFQNEIPADVDPLQLARVIFTCRGCRFRPCSAGNVNMLPLYPAILGHECLYALESAEYVQDPFERAAVSVSRMRNTFNTHEPWSHSRLVVDEEWATRAGEIITALGKDPMTATREEMDAVKDVRLYCIGCAGDSRFTREVHTWKQALRHYAIHETEIRRAEDGSIIIGHQRGPTWGRITDPQALKVILEGEGNISTILADESEQFFLGPWYNCTHCPRGGLTPVGLFQHAKWAHGIQDPKKQDFFRSADGEMAILRATLLLHPSSEQYLTADDIAKADRGRAIRFDFWACAPGPSQLEPIPSS